jgi:hypothetical protein
MQFAEMIGKRQTVVSRLEDPNYGKWTLQTLLDVARKLDVAVFVRFVDFPRFIYLTSDISEEAARPRPYDQSLLEIPARGEQRGIGESALRAFYSMSEQTTQTEPCVSATRGLEPLDKGLSKSTASNTILAWDLVA